MDSSCEIVAQIDYFRNGRVASGRSLLSEAAGTGVSAFKLIALSPEHYASAPILVRPEPNGAHAGTLRDSLGILTLTPETLAEIRAMTPGLRLIVAPYDESTLKALSPCSVDAWQVDPPCNTHTPLLRALAAVARRVYFCTRGCSPEEIDRALRIFENIPLVLVHELRSPPSADLLKDMAMLAWLRSLGHPTGCADDRHDLYPSALGATMGVRVIQKPLWNGPESVARLAEFVRGLRKLERMACSGPEMLYDPEELDRIEDDRMTLVASRPIPRGSLLSLDAVAVKAPARGLSSHLIPFLIGRRVLYDLEKDDPITFGVIE